jgi:DNA polymerase
MIGINPSQTAKLLEHLKSIGYEGDDLRRESVKLSLALPTSTAEMRELLQMRLDYSTTSLAKFDAMVNYAVGNNVQGQFMYHGASTGRWSGKGIQFQNLPRGEFDKKIGDTQMEIAIEAIKNGDVDEWFPHMREMAVMKSAIRGAVIPLMGTELLVMDYSQIEARVLAWLAGQQDVLDAFRSGYDYYKFTASQIYGVPYESVDDKQRFIGKTATLALGYQGGSNAFQKMAINFGVFIDTDKAESIKSMWRIKNNRIQLFWHNLQTAAISAVEGFPKKVSGKIVFRMEGDFLTMRLPSGRKLWYYKPKVEISKKFGNKVLTYVGMHEGHWERRHTYGGHLAENATQAVSRDFVAMSIIKLHEANMPVVLHVHDEIVCEAHKHQAEEKLEEMRNIMLELPYWAEGLPLNAEGFRTTRYRKG